MRGEALQVVSAEVRSSCDTNLWRLHTASPYVPVNLLNANSKMTCGFGDIEKSQNVSTFYCCDNHMPSTQWLLYLCSKLLTILGAGFSEFQERLRNERIAIPHVQTGMLNRKPVVSGNAEEVQASWTQGVSRCGSKLQYLCGDHNTNIVSCKSQFRKVLSSPKCVL